eukprot:5338448-Lingulodinium_polyedra.AAC.1
MGDRDLPAWRIAGTPSASLFQEGRGGAPASHPSAWGAMRLRQKTASQSMATFHHAHASAPPQG